jgi:hypothetical protein
MIPTEMVGIQAAAPKSKRRIVAQRLTALKVYR